MADKESDHEILLVDGSAVPLRLRRSPRARRLTLRLQPAEGALLLTLPPGVDRREGLAFAARQEGWIRGRLAALPPHIPFAPGSRLPLLGVEHEIRAMPAARRGVWREPGLLLVSGRPEHLARRVEDHLRGEARRLLAERARQKVAALPAGGGRALRRVTVRDTASRWGSCSARGDLSFSWRLILAPETVFDYVVAHEVAHLVHLDHSPAFWALTARLTPDPAGPRRWLRERGAELLRYG